MFKTFAYMALAALFLAAGAFVAPVATTLLGSPVAARVSVLVV